MLRSDLEERILDIVGSGEASPFEIAAELCDLVPSATTRAEILSMILCEKLEITEHRNVRIPTAIPNPEDRQ